MSDLRELLLKQRAHAEVRIRELMAATEQRRKALVESLDALQTAKEEFEKIILALSTIEKADAKTVLPSIMQAVLEVLKDRPEGMTALEILAEINKRYFNGKIVRTSLSPQLSRLKDRDHKITLRGNRWYLIGQEQPTLFTRKS
jgi:hypothetical protein